MKLEISREQSVIMRGMAILGICTTNFLLSHYKDCIEQFPKSNEMGFHAASIDLFVEKISNFDFTAFPLFMTWYGVPVFIFLSGYGLAKKYISNEVRLKPNDFLLDHYKKLLWLLLPSFLYFITLYIITENWTWLIYTFISLSFLNELALLPPASYSYWYFSLAFELYIAFLFIRYIKDKYLVISALLILSIQCLFHSEVEFATKMLDYMRHNLWGWLPVFIIGILVAKKPVLISNKYFNKLEMGVIGLLIYWVVIIMNINFYTWLVSPFIAIIAFYFLSFSIQTTKLGVLFSYIGKQSAFLFSAHAVVISLVDMVFSSMPLIFKSVIYVIMLVVLSPIYRIIMQRGSNHTRRTH